MRSAHIYIKRGAEKLETLFLPAKCASHKNSPSLKYTHLKPSANPFFRICRPRNRPSAVRFAQKKFSFQWKNLSRATTQSIFLQVLPPICSTSCVRADAALVYIYAWRNSKQRTCRAVAAAVISKAAAAHHQFIQQQPAGNQPIGSLMKYQLSGAQISHSARSHLSDARVRHSQQPFSTRSTPIITPSW